MGSIVNAMNAARDGPGWRWRMKRRVKIGGRRALPVAVASTAAAVKGRCFYRGAPAVRELLLIRFGAHSLLLFARFRSSKTPFLLNLIIFSRDGHLVRHKGMCLSAWRISTVTRRYSFASARDPGWTNGARIRTDTNTADNEFLLQVLLTIFFFAC